MRKLVCPRFFSINYDEHSQDFGKINYLTNKHIYIIEDFNEDGKIKGQVIKTIADNKGKLYKGNCPVPLNPDKYYFYISDEEVEDENKITKDLCTDEIEITGEFDQKIELPNEDSIKEVIIPVNAYIVEGTYWDNYWDKPDMKKWDKDWMKNYDKKLVKEQFDGTKIIFNNHFEKYNSNVRIKFNITYHFIDNNTLKTIEISDDNTSVLRRLEKNGVINSTSSFSIVFINNIKNTKNEGKKTNGVYFKPSTVAIISYGATVIKNTTAHEIGHILGLLDIDTSDNNINTSYDDCNLMLNPDNLPRDFNKITLTSDDIKLVEKHLKEFDNQPGEFTP